jgi:hypothetical protein
MARLYCHLEYGLAVLIDFGADDIAYIYPSNTNLLAIARTDPWSGFEGRVEYLPSFPRRDESLIGQDDATRDRCDHDQRDHHGGVPKQAWLTTKPFKRSREAT